jgi:hypothetical protein
MKLVTVATHTGGYFPYLQKTCVQFGAKLDVLGWGQQWQGFTWKYLLTKDYLSRLPEDEIVCFIDSFDVLLLRPLEELEAFFRTYREITGAKIVVGCDQPANVVNQFLLDWVFDKCQNKALNSGTYIGFVKDLRVLIDRLLSISSDPKTDDQVTFISYCNSNLNDIHVDCDGAFFLTIPNTFGNFMTPKMHVTDAKEFVYRGIHPFFAHGNAHTHMEDLITALGHDITLVQI